MTCALVFTRAAPTEELLRSVLAPYQKYVGERALDALPYVRDVDITDETDKRLDAHFRWAVIDPDGRWHNYTDNRFWRAATPEEARKIEKGEIPYHELSHGSKPGEYVVLSLPDGWKQLRQSFREAGWDLQRIARHTYGDIGNAPRDPDMDDNENSTVFWSGGRLMHRKNPNGKFCSWVVGGDYMLSLQVKSGRTGHRAMQTADHVASDREFYSIEPWPRKFDAALVRDLDLTEMRHAEFEAADARYNRFLELAGDNLHEIVPYSDFEGNHAEKFKGFRQQPALKAPGKNGFDGWMLVRMTSLSRGEFIQYSMSRGGVGGVGEFLDLDGRWFSVPPMVQDYIEYVRDEAAFYSELASRLDSAPSDAWVTALEIS
jgi:hypothetical protein